MARILFYVMLISMTPVLAPAQIYYSSPGGPGDKILAYSWFRSGITQPPYGLEKITALVAKVKEQPYGSALLDARTLEALSFREQFTYHMIHGEADRQNCSLTSLEIDDERGKIFAYIPQFFGNSGWSKRQVSFFVTHRDSVLALIRENVGHMGANYKQAVVDLNAVEMIPFIVEQAHREPKDHDLLTVLMLLMKAAAYQPFMTSPICKNLYGDAASYRNGVKYSKLKEAAIIDFAMAFHQSQKS